MNDSVKQCQACGAELPAGILACPACARLIHSEELKSLAARAEAGEQSGDLTAALTSWRDALALLPPDSRQHATILEKIRSLSGQVDEGPAPAASPSGWKKGAAGLGGIALVLLKFKNIALLVLTKGKFLLLGLTKMKTLLSMLLFMGVYWTLWSWKFAVGIGLSFYVHEMGHLWMLHRYGIRASAPMFIPGLGAYVRWKQYPVTEIELSRVALAGPMWGLGAAAFCYALYIGTGNEYWGALAQVGGMINLFNLFPFPPFDGGQGIRSLNRLQRILLALVVGVMWYVTSRVTGTAETDRQNIFLAVIGIGAVVRSAVGEAPHQRDDFGLFQYVLLVMTLGALAGIELQVHLR